MHHTRKTHNAHNETQKRLAKLAFKTKGYYSNPKYYRVIYSGNHIWRIDTYFDKYFTYLVSPKVHAYKKYVYDNLEDIIKAKKQIFYKRKPKSSGKKSTWGYYKKQLHRRWRRKSVDELTFTKKDARGCSLRDFWW